MLKKIKIGIAVTVFAGVSAITFADDFQSSSFKVLDPVLFPAGYSTSSSFALIGTISQVAIGTSTGPTSFKLNSGFLFYPSITLPVASASAGDGQATISWTVAEGFLGWTVSGYNIGQSTVSGGPYTYTASLGNVTSGTRVGLSNGSTYYFIVRAEDAFGNSIATSTEISAVPAAAAPTPTPASAGGGGGGIPGSVNFIPPVAPYLPLPPAQITKCDGADFNCDGSVGLDDFSVFLYLSAYSGEQNPADFNHDGKIDLADVSILFTHWIPLSNPQTPTFAVIPFAQYPKTPSIFKPPVKTRRPLAGGVQKETMLGVAIQTAGGVSLIKSAVNFVKSALSTIIGFFRGVVK